MEKGRARGREREREGREEEKVDRGDIGAVTLSDTEFGRTTSRVYTRWIYTRCCLSRFSTTCTRRVRRVYTNVYTRVRVFTRGDRAHRLASAHIGITLSLT